MARKFEVEPESLHWLAAWLPDWLADWVTEKAAERQGDNASGTARICTQFILHSTASSWAVIKNATLSAWAVLTKC